MALSAPISPHPSTTQTSSYGALQRPTEKMSMTQTFYLAHKARGKLSSEATRSDHNLRLLVGHANLLDSLMIHLAHAEAEQERWYYNTVRGNEEWQEAENYGSLATDYDSESDSESESDFDSEEESEDEVEEVSSRPRPQSPSTFKARPSEVVVGVHEITEQELDDEETEEEEEFDDDGMFTLTRTTSHRPPSLCSDLSDEEEDYEEEDTPPTSPESVEPRLPVSAKEFNDVSQSYFDSQLHSSSIHDHDQPPMLFEERMGLSTMIAPVY